MEGLFKEVIVRGLLYFIVVLGFGIWTYAILPTLTKVLEKLRQNKEFELIEKAATIAVRSVQQIMGTSENILKKDEAMKKTLAYLSDKLDVQINVDLIDDAVEKAVNIMKTENKIIPVTYDGVDIVEIE